MNSGHYIFFGETNSPNLGDSVIATVAKVSLGRIMSSDNIEIHDVSYLLRSNDSFLKVIRKVCRVIQIESHSIEYLYYAIRLYWLIPRKSVVCFIGGALFQDFFIEQLLLVLKISYRKKCKFSTISLGIGPLSSRNVSLLRERINCIPEVDISLRDGLFFFQDQIDKRIYWSPDIAILSKYVYGEKTKNNNIIGVGCINIDYYNKNYPDKPLSKQFYYREMLSLITKLQDEGFVVELFCNGDILDYYSAFDIYTLSKGKCSLRPRPVSDNELIDTISNYSCIISARLHSLIISYSYNIPFIGLAWDKKVIAFAESLSLGDFVYPLSMISCITPFVVTRRIEMGYDIQVRQDQEQILCRRLFSLFN